MAARMTTPYEQAPVRDDYSTIVRWVRILLTLVLIPLAWHAFHDEYGAVPMLSGVADALPMKLMLVSGGTGQEVDGHDWNQLLVGWGVLHSAPTIARAMRGAAWLMCVVSIGAGLIAAWNGGRSRDAAEHLNG
jgi:hypothetical protein